GSDAWVCDHQSHTTRFERFAACRGGFAVSRITPSRGRRICACRLGNDGQRPRGTLLFADGERQERTVMRGGKLGTTDGGRAPRHAARVIDNGMVSETRKSGST